MAYTPERRRSPRISVSDEHCRLHVRARVRLLDLSASGALIASEVPLPVGSTGQLRFALGGDAFCPSVQIRRRAGVTNRELLLGSAFISMEERSRRRLEEFLKRATP
jgi:c-di-GMP-binding flagellar brake protein YcgR